MEATWEVSGIGWAAKLCFTAAILLLWLRYVFPWLTPCHEWFIAGTWWAHAPRVSNQWLSTVVSLRMLNHFNRSLFQRLQREFSHWHRSLSQYLHLTHLILLSLLDPRKRQGQPKDSKTPLVPFLPILSILDLPSFMLQYTLKHGFAWLALLH